MKRVREESNDGSQIKRTFGTETSRGESHGQPQNIVGGAISGQKLTTNDALQYLKEVKVMFQDQKGKYDRFLEVMKDFKAQRIDTTGVIARVKELFSGHNHLIYGFNTFLPKGFEITLDDLEAPPKKAVEFEEAINFVNKIKRRFHDDDHVYKSFLDILNMYRKEHKNISEVYDEVSHLFEDHPDLLEEFTRFLPNNSSTATGGRSNLQRYDERSLVLPNTRPMLVDKRWRKGEHDRSVEHPELDERRAPVKPLKESRKRDKENYDRRNHDIDDRELEHESNRDLSGHHLADKRKLLRKVEGFGTTPALTSDDQDALRSMYNREFIFCEKVKEKLGLDQYQAFLKCLDLYTTEVITRDELQNFVTDLLGKHPGLVNEFNGFLQQCENIDAFVAGVMNRKSEGSSSQYVKTDEKDKGLKRKIDPPKVKPNKDYISKSIQELDLSECERCTPSYRLLPSDYPSRSASQRSEIGAEVLNDFWVSVTSGSEDYSFKHMRRNQYEESLFRCEDDRFELDMLLESARSTAKRVEDALNNVLNGPIRLEDYLTPLHLRCIERLYGEHGLEVLDLLRKNPPCALPIILTRLKQRQEEWTKSRADFDKFWAVIYAKNHYKSLDHRSFYFKQQDAKYLSPKSLVAEIKETKEKMQKEDDMLLAVAAGDKRLLVPHFKFEYSDMNIHEDLYKLIKFSCEEVCSTKEQLSKVKRFWTTFLEPMLGVASRSLSVNSIDDVKSRLPMRDDLGSGMGGSPAVNASPRQPKLASSEKSTADVSRSIGSIGDSAAKVLTFSESNGIDKDGSTANAPPNILNDDGVADGASPQNVVQSHYVQGHVESVPGSPSKLNVSEDVQDQSTSETVGAQSGAAGDSAGTFANGTPAQGFKASLHVEECVRHPDIEKEEGELSPNGDTEEENSIALGNEGTQAGSEAKLSTEIQQYQDANVEDVGVGHDGDVDEENSESAGDEVSGSESAGDEGSREEHEQEEDTEHDELEAKAESEGEAEVHNSGGDAGKLSSSERFLMSVKPLAKYVSAAPSDTGMGSRVFYGNDSFYVLFKLHRLLYERILAAKAVCSESKWSNLKDSSHSEPFARFMTALYSVLEGSSDNAKYEDDCRSIIGNQSYVLFTLDKLTYRLVKQLQAVTTDEMDIKLVQLYEYERSRKCGQFVDSVYYENARVLLHEDNIYRLEFSSSPDSMSVQLMDNGNEKSEMVAVTVEPNFATYLNSDFLPVTSFKKETHEVMLQRNKSSYVGLDELSASSKAMEGVELCNGLECKVSCSSSKIYYVLDSEDYFHRAKSKRKSLLSDERVKKARVDRFHKFLSVSSN